jgi:hypothetical protein
MCNKIKGECMNWIQVLTIIGVNIALFGALTTVIIWMVNKLDSDVKQIAERIDSQGNRLDGHAQRIDQLYQMFCRMQEETSKKFYDLLKEQKNEKPR